jgi:hypothetical protein
MNEGSPSFKSKSKNKKSKSKNIMCAWCENRKILLQKHDNNKTRLWQDMFKIGVEQIESNVGFYLYLYPLGT